MFNVSTQSNTTCSTWEGGETQNRRKDLWIIWARDYPKQSGRWKECSARIVGYGWTSDRP